MVDPYPASLLTCAKISPISTQVPAAAVLGVDFSAVSTQLYNPINFVLRKQERKIRCPNSSFKTV